MKGKISLTQTNIDYLRRAFAHFFPEDTIYSADRPFESGEFNWKNRADFIDFVYRLTGVQIKSERDFGNIKKAQLEVENLLSEPAKSEAPTDSNLPDKEARENLEAERLARQTSIEETKRNAEQSVEKTIERKEKIYQSQGKPFQVAQKDIQNKVLEELKGKYAYAVPATKTPEIAFTENEQKFIDIAKNDPQLFSQKLSELIIQKNPDIPIETLQPLSQIIAVDTTQALLNPNNKPLPVGVFATSIEATNLAPDLSNVTKQELVKTASVFTTFSEKKDNLYRTVLLRSVGKNITDSVLGQEDLQYILSSENSDGAFKINFDRLQENSFSFQNQGVFDSFNSPNENTLNTIAVSELKNLALSKTKSFGAIGISGKISGFANSRTFDSIAPFLGLQTNFEYVGTNLLGKSITTLFPEFAPLVTNIASKLGIDVGIASIAPVAVEAASAGGAILSEGVASTGALITKAAARQSLNMTLGNALAKGASSLLTKLGMKAAGAKVGAMVGTGIIPVIGTIIGTVIGTIAGKLLEKIGPWLKKNAPYLIGAVLGIGAFAIAGPVAGIAIGLGAFGVSAAATGGTVSLGAIGSSIGGLFIALGGIVAAPILMPILITLLVMPIVVAVILFIINSGAYVVPPTSSIGLGLNPYIGIEKVVKPSGPFQNSDLPFDVSYQVTIVAKKGTLTTISIKDDCQIISANGTKGCPSKIPEDVPDEIYTSSPYTYSYSQTYSGDEYKNSLIINTVTVRANTDDGGWQETFASATIKTGSPPEDCPNNAWPIAGNQGLKDVTQGPLAKGCSHYLSKGAIDIGVLSKPVVAVHSGIVTVGEDSCLGKFIKIASTCGSTQFSTLYGHLGSVSVKNGQRVTLGQTMGISNNTGSCTDGPHLHFEFLTPESIPTVQKPYLIRNIPVGCCYENGIACN